MSEIVLFGAAPSTYTRTARLVAHEKGVKHELVTIELGTDEHLALHPFGKIPALTHGDLTLFETSAIARYLDEIGDGPSLVPSATRDRAAMEQWVSITNAYLYGDLIKSYLFPYLFPKTADGKPSRELIDTGLPALRRDLALLDEALAKSDWIAGKSLSVADLFLAPILFYVAMFPEGQETVGGLRNVQRFQSQMKERPSFLATMPPKR